MANSHFEFLESNYDPLDYLDTEFGLYLTNSKYFSDFVKMYNIPIPEEIYYPQVVLFLDIDPESGIMGNEPIGSGYGDVVEDISHKNIVSIQYFTNSDGANFTSENYFIDNNTATDIVIIFKKKIQDCDCKSVLGNSECSPHAKKILGEKLLKNDVLVLPK